MNPTNASETEDLVVADTTSDVTRRKNSSSSSSPNHAEQTPKTITSTTTESSAKDASKKNTPPPSPPVTASPKAISQTLEISSDQPPQADLTAQSSDDTNDNDKSNSHEAVIRKMNSIGNIDNDSKDEETAVLLEEGNGEENNDEEEEMDEMDEVALFGDRPNFNSNDDGIDDEELDRLMGNVENGVSSNGNTNTNNVKKGHLSVETVLHKRMKPSCCGTVRHRLGFGGNEGQTSYKIGNTLVVCPKLHEWTRGDLGVIGPHWWGTICTLLLLLGASYHFTSAASKIGIGSSVVCVGFTLMGLVSLFFVACADPGVITRERQRMPADERDLSDWRFCDLCSVYQPPKAAHCPDCNVCVDGYDHHCPWMGTCIGKKNMRAFVAFNFSWVFYLLYAIVWVTVLGPLTVRK